MKMFMLLSCLVGSTMATEVVSDYSGELTVTYADNVISVAGDLTGLPPSQTASGVHIHEGKVCTDPDRVLGHLWSNNIDGWAFPTPITYNSDANGAATIDVTATSFSLATADGTTALPAVENRCVVLHGVADNNLSPRVAVGQILPNAAGDGYKATIGPYPGLDTGLGLSPAGELTVTVDGETNAVTLQGPLTGLGVSLTGAGIHIHEGLDCSTNTLIAGHLFSTGDGFQVTTYDSDAAGAGTIAFSTPAGSYTLLTADNDADVPSVQDRCIVFHDAAGNRKAVAQIVCTAGATTSCTAPIEDYPIKLSAGMMSSLTAMTIAVVALW